MGSVYLADQLRGLYRLDKNTRNRKWWWSIMFWSIGVMLTNAYIMYMKVNVEEYVIAKRDLITHHDFRKAIALYWINPAEYDQELKAEKPYDVKRNISSTSTVSSVTVDSSVSYSTKTIKTGLHHVTYASLCPITGNLRCRIGPMIDHIPYESGVRARCRLHWWGGVETQKNILACPGCGVSF